ncbi:MAG: polysaccharide biosynthesis tyrosine autokinase, partial [Actinomycetota bacterium]|nr:polysaccharide biosynthesis tyrosine autokinase [Actinomycetota bacterium]
MADDVTLGMLFQDIRRRWRVAILVALAVTAGAALYAESLPKEFTSSVVVAFAPKPAADVGADTVRVVIPRYVAYVTSRATANRVAASLGEEGGSLKDSVDAVVEPDSANLVIRVTLPSARRAADAANALAADTLDFAATDQLLDAVVVAQALPSRTASGPPRKLYELAGLLMGLLAGTAVALLFERGRPRVRSWRDVALVTGYSVVGRVPPTRALRGPTVDALTDPAVGAAVRTLRTNLERISREQPVHVLEITSSLPGEGKTTVASTLSVALARLDAHVLLVDADLRRPALHRLFGLSNRHGLTDLLLDDRRVVADFALDTHVPGLQVLPSGPQPPNPSEALSSRRMRQVLEEMRQIADVMILDSPPLLAVADGLV